MNQPVHTEQSAARPVVNDAKDEQMRVPAVVVTDYELSIDTTIHADWKYNRRQYELWEIYNHWPAGFLLHVAGPAEGRVPVQAIWRRSADQHQYMADVGVHKFTEMIRVMTEEGGEGPTVLADVEPIHRRITHLAFGPLAVNFIDIGADLDESSGKQLGTVLTAIDIELPTLSTVQIDDLWRRLELVDHADPELIMRLQEMQTAEDGEAARNSLRETQVWSSADAARRFVETELLPELEAFGVVADDLPEFEYREIRRIAISSAELSPDRFAS